MNIISAIKAVFVLMMLGAIGVSASDDVSSGVVLTSTERQLVGTWAADIGFSRWVIVRYPDKTFRQEEVSMIDDKRPAIQFSSRGTWSAKGRHYVMQSTAVSSQKFKVRLKEKSSFTITNITPDELDYFGEDTPNIIEKKIGTPTDDLSKIKPNRLTGTERNRPVEEH